MLCGKPGATELENSDGDNQPVAKCRRSKIHVAIYVLYSMWMHMRVHTRRCIRVSVYILRSQRSRLPIRDEELDFEERPEEFNE